MNGMSTQLRIIIKRQVRKIMELIVELFLPRC